MSWLYPLTFDPRPLVAQYIAQGGQVARLPFGVSGANAARLNASVAGRIGCLKRYGARATVIEARAAFRAGKLRLVEARAETVWRAIAAHDSAPRAAELAARLGLSPAQVAAALRLLERDGYVKRDRCRLVISSQTAPDWRDYLRAA